MPRGKTIFTESVLHKVIFYLTLGVPAKFLAEVFNAAPDTVSEQIRKLRKGKLKGATLPPAWTFRKQTSWFLSNHSNRTDPLFRPLYNALAPQYEELGLGASKILVQVLSGDREPDDVSRGYRNLLRVVVGKSPMNISRGEVDDERKLVLRQIMDGDLKVESAAQANAVITARMFARLRDGFFSDFLSQQDMNIVDQVVGTLPDLERAVIRYSFGLQYKIHTLEEIAGLPQMVGKKRQVGKILDAGLRKLRHPSRYKYLREITHSLPWRYSKISGQFHYNMNDVLPTPAVELPDINLSDKIFSRPVAELELSVGAETQLEEANVRNIGDLVQKGEKEMSRSLKLGRRYLNQTREQLAKMDRRLRFGMVFDEAGKLTGYKD